MSPQGQNTAVGAGAGAALGAGLGALIGDSSHAALIGAGLGSVVGGVVGYNWKAVKQSVEKSGASSLGVAVTEMPDGSLKVNIPSNVSFSTNQSVLKPQLLPVLDSVAKAMNEHPELRAKSIGYTDSSGSNAINQPLSQRRAAAVTQYLSGQGVATTRLTAEGRGSASPIGDNSTPEGRALNRRVELFLYAVKQ
ncbi:MAG: OmpA family protein [Castellaniella sp.]|uniref:OmpA family protein n=1 Tax=Castellaniella sp. TaxID=1955812 RepID=UPI0012297E1E|nr:OmpA family protein [Castellaniella sp.]TAN27431.1 MAG: OmpA family protein [Castellaniella sp.]